MHQFEGLATTDGATAVTTVKDKAAVCFIKSLRYIVVDKGLHTG
jgi:hypothetical protein